MGVLPSVASYELKKIKPSEEDSNTPPLSQPENQTLDSTHIHSLPQELLIHIFSFLSLDDLYNTVPKVCTYWKDLHLDPHLYKSLKIERDTKLPVINLLRRAPLLKKLTVVNRPRKNVRRILEEVGQHNHQVRVLVLDNIVSHSPSSIKATVMNKLIQNCTNLQILKVQNYFVQNDEFYKNLTIHLPHLRALHLINGGKFSYMVVPHLINSCLNNIEQLVIYNDKTLKEYLKVTDSDTKINVVALCERFCKTLRFLALEHGEWSLEAFLALKKCALLDELLIFNTQTKCCMALLTICSMPNLRHLAFYSCMIPENTWIQLIESSAWTSLVSLKLYWCNATDNVAMAVGAHLKNLLLIDVSGREMDTSGIGVSRLGVESVIKGCAALQEMCLYFMDQSVQEAILLIPEYLPRLKDLIILQDNDLEWDTVNQIQPRMPELQTTYVNVNSNITFFSM